MSFAPAPTLATSPVGGGPTATAATSSTAALPYQVGAVMAAQSLMNQYFQAKQGEIDNIYRDLAVELGSQAAMDMMTSAEYQTDLANLQDAVAVRSAIAAEERAGLRARGEALQSAADRGVSGQSLDVQLNTIEQRIAANQQVLESDLFARREQRAEVLSGIRANALSRINQLRAMPRAPGFDLPSALLSAGTQGATTAFTMRAMQRNAANQSLGVQ